MKNKSIILTIFLFAFLSNLVAQEKKQQIHRWKFGINAGAGYYTPSNKDAKRSLEESGVNKKTADSFYNKLKWAATFDVHAYYLFNSNMGAGIRYNFARSSAKESDIHISNSFYNLIVDIEDRVYVNYVGPSFYFQKWIDSSNKWLLNGSITLGYVHYREESEVMYSTLLATAHSIGSSVNIGVEYFFNKSWSVGLDYSFFGSTLNRVKIDDGYQSESIKLKGDDKINLSRMNLMAGIRFHL